MKIALINARPSNYPPLGLATIASNLVESGHKVSIYEWNYRMPQDVDLVGISGLSIWLKQIREIIDLLPNKDIPCVVGGPCITANPKVFRSLGVDYGVVGEGEETLCELVDCLEKDKSPKNVEGLLTKHAHNYQPRPFMDLTNKPVPAWNLLPNLNYKSGLGVETSRGCPFNCVFCNAPLISGRKWRSRTPAKIVQEIYYIMEKYKPKRIYFADDNCTVNPKRWKHLCLRLAQLDLGVEFHVPEGMQAHHLNMETLVIMKKAGFKSVTIGVESGSQRVLDDVIDKGGLSLIQVERVVRDCVKIGLKVSCFFVIGILGETLTEMKWTLNFARHLRKLGAESCSIRNCLPVPGTRLWRIAEEGGNLLISEEEAQDHVLLHSGKHYLKSEDWTPEQVEALTKRGERENRRHLRKKHKLHSLKSLVKRLVAKT